MGRSGPLRFVRHRGEELVDDEGGLVRLEEYREALLDVLWRSQRWSAAMMVIHGVVKQMGIAMKP